MKKQIRLSIVYISSLLILLPVMGVVLSTRTVAAPGTCYQEQAGSVARIPQCPDPINTGAARISYSATPTAGNCYNSTGITEMPYGTLRTYTQTECAGLEQQERDAAQALCTASGGSWTTTAGGGAPVSSCSCGEDRVLNPGSRQCGAIPISPAGGSDSGSLDIRETREADCRSENGEDLTEENCGIIGILNIVFNLVSGAISIAVIGNIIVAGIQYSSAQGDPGAAAKAKTRIRNALIAFLMYLGLFGFIQWLIPGGVF